MQVNANYFFSLLKYSCLAIVRIILGIKIVRSLETSNHIVRNLVYAFQKVVEKLVLKIVMQLDMFCQNQLLARSEDDNAYSKKHHISLNEM